MLSINDTQHNNIRDWLHVEGHYAERFIYFYAECHRAECHYAERCVLFILMLSVIVLNLVVLNVVIQSVIVAKDSDKYEKVYNIDNRMNLTHQGLML